MGGWDQNGTLGVLLAGVERIQLAHNKNRWRSLVNTVKTFEFWPHGVSLDE
jgi:hypothetical protein